MLHSRQLFWVLIAFAICVSKVGDTKRTDCLSRPVRILALGDSISTCHGLKPDFSFGYLSYRRPLSELLRGHGYDESTVEWVGTKQGCNKKLESKYPAALKMPQAHDAVFGRTASSLTNRVRSIVQTTTPDVILLLIGINDLLLEGSTVEALCQAHSQIADNIRRELNDTFSSITVLRGSLLPVNPTAKKLKKFPSKIPLTKMNSFVQSINRMFAQAKCIGTPGANPDQLQFTSVDLTDGYSPENMTYDGLHPNHIGEDHIAQAWLKELSPVLDGLRCSPKTGRSQPSPSVPSTRVVTVSPPQVASDQPTTQRGPEVVLGSPTPSLVQQALTFGPYALPLFGLLVLLGVSCRRKGK
jgi:lysophospholipase L1-like esterase